MEMQRTGEHGSARIKSKSPKLPLLPKVERVDPNALRTSARIRALTENKQRVEVNAFHLRANQRRSRLTMCPVNPFWKNSGLCRGWQ